MACNDVTHSRAVIDVLADICERFLKDMSAITLCIDLMSSSLPGGSLSEKVEFVISILATMCVIVTIVIVPLSYVTDVMAGEILELLEDTVIAVMPVIFDNAFAGTNASMQSTTMTAMHSIPVLVSPEEIFDFG